MLSILAAALSLEATRDSYTIVLAALVIERNTDQVSEANAL